LERCTSSSSGLLTGGLFYDAADEGACVHHSFAHAKSLVDFLLSGATDVQDDSELPREQPYGIREFPSFGTTLASTKDWCASFSVNDVHHNDEGTACGGGSLTLLWHRAAGLVVAGTMLRYSTIERENMQEQRRDRDTRCLMPRIESKDLTNTSDRQAAVSVSNEGSAISYVANGFLSDDSGVRTARPFSIRYGLDGNRLAVRAQAAGKWRYVFPVVAGPSDAVQVSENGVEIRRSAMLIRVKSSRTVRMEHTTRGERAFTPVAGLMAAYLVVDVPSDESIDLEVAVVHP